MISQSAIESDFFSEIKEFNADDEDELNELSQDLSKVEITIEERNHCKSHFKISMHKRLINAFVEPKFVMMYQNFILIYLEKNLW